MSAAQPWDMPEDAATDRDVSLSVGIDPDGRTVLVLIHARGHDRITMHADGVEFVVRALAASRGWDVTIFMPSSAPADGEQP